MRRVLIALGALLLSALLLAPPAVARTPALKWKRTSSALKLSARTTMTRTADGVEHYHFVYGPIHISPGQNSIFLDPVGPKEKPAQDGWILSFNPNLIEQDGTIPRVDQIHLHHVVWLTNGMPTFGAGEEKTQVATPKGFGFPYKTTDTWQINHMIHNLTPQPDVVYMTYDIDFLPASAPQAAGMIAVHQGGLDVQGGHAYPVFDALRGTGHKTAKGMRFTYPDDAVNPYPNGVALNRRVITKPQTLVWAAVHLHPGGLYGDVDVTRNGVTKLLFRSRARYWEPAGAVSWDVSMTNTPGNWKINLNPGDVISLHVTYDTTKASWYESMGIMFMQAANGHYGVDPFTHAYPTSGPINHGPLAENRNHGGRPAPQFYNPLKQLDGPVGDGSTVSISDFFYSQGNMAGGGFPSRPPVLRQGQTLTFRNDDAPPGLIGKVAGGSGTNLPIYHTITDCKSPCTGSTGIAYPLANGSATFDSGELGYGPAGITAAAQRQTWTVPKTLKPGTYTYFCRIHPFMRGAFRVVKAA